MIIVHSRCISSHRSESLFQNLSPVNIKRPSGNDPKPVISSYSVDIMRLSPRIVAIARYFRLFLSISIKNNHPCFVSKHEWLGGSSGRTRTYNPSVNSRMLCHWATEEYLSWERYVLYRFVTVLSTLRINFFILRRSKKRLPAALYCTRFYGILS